MAMDVERIERLLADIEEPLRVAESITALDYGEFMRDVRNRYTVRLIRSFMFQFISSCYG